MPAYDLRFAERVLGPLAIAAVLATGLAIGAPHSSLPTPLVGIARAVDGDTLQIGDTRVRLEGIDAPEADQQCRSAMGGSWPCGRAATRRLAALVSGNEIRCESHGHDRYGRLLGVCRLGQLELNSSMVREGLAWAFLKYSDRYREAEAEARVLKIGIWQSETEPPWTYREKRWATAEPAAPSGCAIKGNVTRQGRIYHTPWSPWYDKTRVDTGKGERWFCSEGEALAAGWRPAQP